MQRLTVAEGSFKDIEKRVHLCLRSISVLRSIQKKSSLWWERDRTNQVEATTNRTMSHLSGVTPSTLDRDEQMLQSLLMSCQHSGDWAAQYSKRVNIQIQLVRTPISPICYRRVNSLTHISQPRNSTSSHHASPPRLNATALP